MTGHQPALRTQAKVCAASVPQRAAPNARARENDMSRTLGAKTALLSAALSLAVTGLANAGDAPGAHHEEAAAREVGAAGSRTGSPHPPVHGGQHFQEPMEAALDLTEEQTRALRRIRRDYETVTIDKTAAIRVGEVELAALLGAAQPSLDAIEQKVRAIGALRVELMMHRVQSLLKLRTILTEGQYNEFQDVLMQRMESMAEGPVAFGH